MASLRVPSSPRTLPREGLCSLAFTPCQGPWRLPSAPSMTQRWTSAQDTSGAAASCEFTRIENLAFAQKYFPKFLQTLFSKCYLSYEPNVGDLSLALPAKALGCMQMLYKCTQMAAIIRQHSLNLNTDFEPG